MRSFILFVIFCVSSYLVTGQSLVSATLNGSRTKAQITSLFSLNLVRNGAKFYKISYTSKDAKGQPDTLSGLMVIPDDLRFTYPTLVYQHGTSDCKKCVPSSFGTQGGEEGQLGLLFAGLGYVAVLPDYVGMGDGRGFQTYVHDATTVSATEDMMKAVKEWTAQNGVVTNDQLFITGYSQGGYASMSYHQHVQKTSGAAAVTAAAHLSGPYSLSGVMRDLILGEAAYNYPAYVPNTVLGFNEVYNIYNDLGEFFKPEYVDDIKSYYNGTLSLFNMNTMLAQKLITNTGASVGGRLIRDDVMAEIRSNPNHRINQILKENDLYRWKPESPTRIFYCKADDQVPYLNSIVARDSMYARGTSNSILQVVDVNSTANHGTCVSPALTNSLLFFLSFQRITTSTQDGTIGDVVTLYPNPTSDYISIKGDVEVTQVIIWDLDGRQRMNTLYSNDIVSTKDLESGTYIVTLINDNGVISNEKLVIQR
jgi:Secretion system C-terminal sorting domain/Prolyl oligopeptidase family